MAPREPNGSPDPRSPPPRESAPDTGRARLHRDAHGVVHVRAPEFADALWGLGWAHARDRGLQMLVMRLLGQGRACEVLDGGDETLAVDVFFRRMNWTGGSAAPDPGTTAAVAAYCAGVNARFARRVPWELRLLGYRPEPWSVEDCLVLARMTGYLSLAQSQAGIERLVVELVQAGVGRDRLEELFPGQLDGLDEALLCQVVLGERLVPVGTRWASALAAPVASNNWAIAGRKTATGAPSLASDPHLEANRLPNVWYEAVLETPERWMLGATMPGLPGVLIGRNPDLAWGATYAYMDAVDSWVEECRDGAFRRDEPTGRRWVPFHRRREVIRRRRRPDHCVTVFENDHGVLDGDPDVSGLYLATRWSGAGCGERSLRAMVGMWGARSVDEGRSLLGSLEPAFNWVLADRDGHIGYQMSGLLPRRRGTRSGLLPRRGWDPDDDWHGFHDPSELPRALDPDAGFLATANEDLDALGRVPAISISRGPYRADRIATLLTARDDWTLDEVRRVQADVRSPQAERLMSRLRPLLPDTPAGRVLAAWDCGYDEGSLGASLFEQVYEELLRAVFGGVLGEAWDALVDQTTIVADFHHRFDDVLVREDSAWLSGRDPESTWRAAIAAGLERPARPWGERQRIVLSHLLFRGRLPRFAGFDRGPIPLVGGRATIRQGQACRAHGRSTSFAPTFKLVTDLSENRALTSLLGGPSDRRFSRWYASEVEDWVAGRYKEVGPSG